MSTIRQKLTRETRQVRISGKWHRIFKVEAAEKGVTISKLLDSVFQEQEETRNNGFTNNYSVKCNRCPHGGMSNHPTVAL